MNGHFIDAAGGRAYIAVPEAGEGPGLLVLPDVFDGDQDRRELGDFYAAEGYIALCPEVSALSRGAEDIMAASSGPPGPPRMHRESRRARLRARRQARLSRGDRGRHRLLNFVLWIWY